MKQPDISIKKLRVSKHAAERAVERFNCKNETDAVQFVKSKLDQAKYIGITTCEQGNDSHMYCVSNMAIYVSLELDAIKSVTNLVNQGHYVELRSRIEQMYFKEFRKTDRLERSKNNKLKLTRLKNEAEIAALRLRIYKTRSKTVKTECEQLIIKLQNEIREYEVSIRQIETKKREIARAIATVL